MIVVLDRDKVIQMPPLSTSEIRLSFSRNAVEVGAGYLLVVDDDGDCQECFLFRSL
jgi:hypothetical protein